MDLVGKKIHELTILKRIRKNNRTYYKVRCSCGKEFETRRDSITSGRTKSCGHLTQFQGEDITNKRFGKLIAIKQVGKNKEGRYLWECICDCGNTTITNITLLKKGNTKSCGCIVTDILENKKEEYRKSLEDKHYKEKTFVPSLDMKIPKHNTSGIKGVSWDKSREKWLAQIDFQGKKKFLGRFNKIEDAIKARKAAEDKYFKPVIEKHKKKD